MKHFCGKVRGWESGKEESRQMDTDKENDSGAANYRDKVKWSENYKIIRAGNL